jgi:hypothetical protein
MVPHYAPQTVVHKKLLNPLIVQIKEETFASR